MSIKTMFLRLVLVLGLVHGWEAKAFYNPNTGRWLSRDLADEKMGGKNLYGFVQNLPTQLYDYNGLWPTHVLHVHQESISRVISGRISQFYVFLLEDQQVFVDEFQSSHASFVHAMRGPHETPYEARRKANTWVYKELTLARYFRKQCRWGDAIPHLGNAMHTLQDHTSPVHVGFQLWDDSWGKIHSETWQHVLGELYDPGADSSLDRATEKAWRYFMMEGPIPTEYFFEPLPPDFG